MEFEIFDSIDIKEDQKEFIINNSKKLEVLKNAILHSPKENINVVSLVLEGKLKVVKYSFDGNQQVIKCIEKGETFGESFIFSDKPYPAYIMAEKDSIVLEISKNTLLELFKDRNVMITYIKKISSKILNLSNIIEILLVKSIEERLIMYFSFLHKEQKSEIIYFKSKADIAANIGSVREVVSKKMKILQEKGIIELIDKHHFKILKSFY
jgi:CRP-like cAMP-binding protein